MNPGLSEIIEKFIRMGGWLSRAATSVPPTVPASSLDVPATSSSEETIEEVNRRLDELSELLGVETLTRKTIHMVLGKDRLLRRDEDTEPAEGLVRLRSSEIILECYGVLGSIRPHICDATRMRYERIAGEYRAYYDDGTFEVIVKKSTKAIADARKAIAYLKEREDLLDKYKTAFVGITPLAEEVDLVGALSLCARSSTRRIANAMVAAGSENDEVKDMITDCVRAGVPLSQLAFGLSMQLQWWR